MNNSMTLLAVGGAVLATGIAVYAFGNQERSGSDILDLPEPGSDEIECTTADTIWQSTADVLADPDVDAGEMRKAAATLKEWQYYCDDTARQMGQACIAALEARAEVLEGTQPGQTPPPSNTVKLPPSPIELPGGHYYAGFGWCLPGAILDMSTGLCEMTPGNIPAPIIRTTGACCGSCADGHECEEDCVS